LHDQGNPGKGQPDSFSMPIRSDAEAGPNLGQFDIYEEFDFIKASRDRARLLQVWNDSV